ncbi:MAG: cation:dicarboxylase symporter family transporter [Chitinophagaceae bacterium]
MKLFSSEERNNNKLWAIISLALFTISSIFHLAQDSLFHIPSAVLTFMRWIVIISFLVYGFYKRTLTVWILLSMLIGMEIGMDLPEVAKNLRFLSKIFINLIKTIIAPIIISTLVIGIAGHSNMKQLGRMGWKSLLYFEIVTTIALFIGLFAINISKAGVGVTIPEGLSNDLPATEPKTWQEIIIHIFPENIIKSIYHGDVLPIVLFSVIFGIALALVKSEKKVHVMNFMEGLAETMFKFTEIIMYFAPIGVGAAMAYTVGHMGIGFIKPLFMLLATLYIALFVFILLVFIPVALIAKIPIKQFIKAVSEPVTIAFATTSSESALPKAFENMEKFGVPRKVVSFVLPTGYSFNLDGTTLYLALASVFVAQAAGIHLSFGQQILMVFTLMLTSKGVAGVPRASLVILLGTAASFNLPVWPIMAILGIDELMDMARTSVNVIGNCLASVVVARWENEFDDAKAKSFGTKKEVVSI